MPEEYIDKPCECIHAGWCDRHRFVKTMNHRQLCIESPRYRKMWDAQAPLRTEEPPLDYISEQHEVMAVKTIGLGDTLAALTSMFGFVPCGGCKQRQDKWNKVQIPFFANIAPTQPRVDTLWLADHRLPESYGTPDSRWAVGVTTAYRSHSSLIKSLHSLCNAGFTDIRVFAEPGSVLPMDVPGITLNDHIRGLFQNWRYALRTLVEEKPDAEFYCLFQDDVLYARNLKAFLELDLWFVDDVGFISPYRSSGKSVPGPRRRRGRDSRIWNDGSRYIAEKTGYREVANMGTSLWGALTYIFPRASVDIILADERLKRQERMIDLNIHPILAAHKRRAYYYSPSLAEHIKGPSSIGHGQGDGMSSPNFPGEQFDCLSLLEGSTV